MAPSVLRGAEGEAIRVGARFRAYVSNRLGPFRAAFALAHELAHVHLGILEHGAPELEALCDGIAACVLCPRRAFRAAVSEHGRQAWAQLALDFGTDETCAALRVGEVVGIPLVVVAPRSIRVRGDAWTWPDERALRRLARNGGPGVERAVLRDDARRVVLVADDAA